MHNLRSLVFLSTSTALGLAGCFYNELPEPDPELPLASSFEVTARFSYPEAGIGSDLLDSESFLLRLDDAPDRSVTAVIASRFGADDSSFRRAGERILLDVPVTVPVNVSGDHGVAEASVTLEEIDLTLVDADANGVFDGSVDAVVGTGAGTLEYLTGDILASEPFTFELSGSLDTSQPDLYLAATDRLHVLDGLTLQVSEPLRRPDTAEISAGGLTIPLETFPLGASYVMELSTSSILPFGVDVGVSIEPEPKDLAGFGIQFELERIQTMEDPGLFSEDGFEGALAAASSGVEVVTGIGSLSALGGAQSVLIGESHGRMTMRVPLQEGDTHLRFEARVLHEAGDIPGCALRRLRLGFPALDTIEQHAPVWNLGAEQETGDERWVSAGPLATMEFALPEGAGSEVIFDIQPASSSDPCPAAALLIDDLRAE